MDYKDTSWNLYDKVLLVCKPRKDKNYYEAYVVDPNNKSQLKSAINWAKHWNESKKEYDTIQFEFDNEDFIMEIFSSANNSSQGGKLSFWSCLFKKDNKIFKIGINSRQLETLIQNTTIIKGQVQEPVCFARYAGQVGVLTPTMPQYEEALSIKNLKESFNKAKKTSKYTKGGCYETLTSEHLCLGEVKSYYKLLPIFDSMDNRYGIHVKPIFIKLKTPINNKLVVERSWYSFETSIKNILLSLAEKRYWREKKDGVPEYEVLSKISPKVPARSETSFKLKIDDTQEDWDRYINSCLIYLKSNIDSYDPKSHNKYRYQELCKCYYKILCLTKEIPEDLCITQEEYDNKYSNKINNEIQNIENNYYRKVELIWV